ncbi:hypothetical protein [Rickettsia tamurae]|uniref:hypothetical protein n=1 Tax=Rickettsia tamurae TaxID=334545 RepID=UPI000A5F5CEF|nr:hypothetical protein [Rickettsia tamurae]
MQNNLDEHDLNSLIPNNLTSAPIPPNNIIAVDILGKKNKEKTPCLIKCLML